MKSKFFVFLLSLFMLPALLSFISCGKKAVEGEIIIGSLNDTTGPTSDVGKDYAMGIREAIQYVNDEGGINGKQIRLHQFDYGYKIPEALTKYNKFKQLKCIAILGWGTGDTEALSAKVTQDKIPYVSASYSAHLNNPGKTPYNLYFAADYSTQVRGLITVWFDKKWKSNSDFGKRKPRLVFSYHKKHPFSSAAIKAGKDQAALLGFEVGPDEDVSLRAIDTKSNILSMKKFKPDVVVHTNTTASVVATLRDAYALKLGADHLVKCWGFDENLPKLAKQAAEGVMGAASWAFFGLDVELMDEVKKYAKKLNPGIPLENRTVRTTQAWASVLGLAEALKRADKAGDLSGPGIIKKGFETMDGFKIGLGVAPVTFTSTDHRALTEASVYHVKDGKIVFFGSVDLKKRWPDKWEKEWLGW